MVKIRELLSQINVVVLSTVSMSGAWFVSSGEEKERRGGEGEEKKRKRRKEREKEGRRGEKRKP